MTFLETEDGIYGESNKLEKYDEHHDAGIYFQLVKVQMEKCQCQNQFQNAVNHLNDRNIDNVFVGYE